MNTTVTWLTYDFTVYTKEANWNNTGGIYIFTGKNPQGLWVPLYIGKADNFQSRLVSHERWDESIRAGATHVRARGVAQEATREAIEAELIRNYQPKLNTLLK